MHVASSYLWVAYALYVYPLAYHPYSQLATWLTVWQFSNSWRGMAACSLSQLGSSYMALCQQHVPCAAMAIACAAYYFLCSGTSGLLAN
ncbi:hypothetical protein NPIL_641611 [Nephila pilipes]|uniref:Uncharacterized protein n=1 Tax=Nephila pilipes TaxID=299642 RepID=A0A8X6TYS9_NEPPI|nr:hypothetical protein NPIL_641611 [Nephila pilipes]